MSFQLWCRVILKASPSGNEPIKAKLHNICTENRVVQIEDLKQSIGNEFSGDQTLPAAERAAAAGIAPLYQEKCALLGLIPTKSAKHCSFQAVSFVTGIQIERNIMRTFDASAATLPPQVSLPDPLFAQRPRRFVWATFAEEVKNLNPTEIAVQLGLPHFLTGQAIYRIELGTWPDTVYIPTCMDSGAYEAWKRPSASHTEPWGMTRHLVTGHDCKPEILVDVIELSGRNLIAHRVGINDERIAHYQINYLVGRSFDGIAA